MGNRTATKTGGRAATTGTIDGDFALAVGVGNRTPPTGWQWRLLTDVARLETGHTPSRKHPEYWDGEIPWVGIRDATGNHGRIIHNTEQRVTQAGIENSSARLLPKHTVCLSRTASVGYVIVMGRPMATSQDFVNWICDPDALDYRYLKYVLLAEKNAFSRFAHGTTHQTIYFPEVKAFHVCAPDVDGQRAIADILSALDDKIEQNRRTAQTLERLARAIFRAWFVDFEPVKAKAEGATSFPSMPQEVFDALPTRFVDSAIGPVPEGWEVKAVSEVFDVNPTRSLRKGESAPYLDMKSMPTNGHAPDSWIERPFGSGMRFINGDTLVARITPCLENGKTAFVDFLDDGQIAWGSTEYIVLRPKPPLPPIFAYCLARTTEFRDHAIQNMTGTSGRQRVAAASLDHYSLAVPDARVAGAFGQTVSPMFDAIRAAMSESRKLEELRDFLLPKIMTGTIKFPEDKAVAVEAV